AVQRPISLQCIQEPVAKPGWRSKPSWFLIAEEDRMINPKTQHFMAKRMGATTRSRAVDHTPLLSAPQKVVDIIIEAKQTVFCEQWREAFIERGRACATDSSRFHWPEYLMEAAEVGLYLFLTCVFAVLLRTLLRRSATSLVALEDCARSWGWPLAQR